MGREDAYSSFQYLKSLIEGNWVDQEDVLFSMRMGKAFLKEDTSWCISQKGYSTDLGDLSSNHNS